MEQWSILSNNFRLNQVQFSQETEKYFSKRQAFASFPIWLLRSEENIDLHKFPTLWCQVLVKMLTFTISNTMVSGVGEKVTLCNG